MVEHRGAQVEDQPLADAGAQPPDTESQRRGDHGEQGDDEREPDDDVGAAGADAVVDEVLEEQGVTAPAAASAATSTRKTASSPRYGRANPSTRRTVPGASLCLVTDESWRNEDMPPRGENCGTDICAPDLARACHLGLTVRRRRTFPGR
ncbi:hypothetical protein GCM10025865_28510 [Paraoerskovia sediminicola]|uniref:Uncharacterized protein n=1 Tax=Paraoerskovia sediminicola TaxID=1138587 RepID=A0ABN6XF56_9CELL|nr:hypothetical protein GCM10025865_28510 [Paraoerskovia sediminicola]